MAVAFVRSQNSGEVTVSPISFNIDLTGGDGLRVVISDRANPPVTASTVKLDATTNLTKLRTDGNGGANDPMTEIWYWDPVARGPLPSGTHSVDIVLSGTPSDAGAGALVFSGTHQTSPVGGSAGGAGDFGTGSTASKSITTLVDGCLTMAVLMVQQTATISINGGDTQLYDLSFAI